MYRFSPLYILNLFLFYLIVNTTYAGIVSDIHEILVSGQEAFVIYTKKVTASNISSRHIFIYDTKTGQKSQLTETSKFTNESEVDIAWISFTWDGRRIVFYNKPSNNVYVINRDGTGLRLLTTGYWSSNTWRSPVDNSDWVICAVKGDSLGPVYRINIDTGEKVLLWNKTSVGTTRYENWASLSADGKYMTATFPWEKYKGIVSVPNGNDMVNLGKGCWVSMAHDSSADVLEISDHKRITIVDKKGNTILNESNLSFFGVGPADWWIDKLRWANVRDNFVFTITSSYWYDQRGVAIGSFSKKSFFRLDPDGDIPHIYIYSGTPVSPVKPTIIISDTIKALPNIQINANVFVDATPLATLQATSLPTGLQLLNGQIPSSIFLLSGKLTTKGTYTVQLTASNSVGTSTKSVCILVTEKNLAPVVKAPDSVEVAVNDSSFRLTAAVSDDGLLRPLTYVWKCRSGPVIPRIVSPASLQTAVILNTEGSYLFEIAVYDGGLTTFDTVKVIVKKSVPFKIVTPKAGDTLQIGSTVNIQWQRDVRSGVLIDVSTNNGLSWTPLTNTLAVGTDGTMLFQWTIDNTLQPSTKCKLKIYDYFDHSNLTQTEGTFVLKAPSSGVKESFNKKSIHLTIRKQTKSIELNFRNTDGNRTVVICNSLGRIIYKKTSTGFLQERIPITSKGVILCKLISENNQKVQKFTFAE